ncbi:MAG TPA: FtsX-like permease family protein [Candidatus Sulfopaludibacter sp.]|nr:FtsX-like permease family protein [Candidatus Sulfopaludibacter sp.]
MTKTLAAIDPDPALYGAETMEHHVAQSLWEQHMAMGWIGAFSLVALGLAAVGLYAAIAHSTARRVREVGIRTATGATSGAVSRLVAKEGMRLALAGLAAGLPVALGLSKMLRADLAANSARDPVTYLGAGLVLAVASRVDPVEALWAE